MEEQRILEMYYEEMKSLPEIADHYNTYTNKIRRIILKSGRKLRTKSESQLIALNSGRAIHPTKGTERPEETKLKLSESAAQAWANKSDQEKTKIKKKLSRSFKKRNKKDVQEMHKKAAQAVYRSSREGSKLEKYLVTKLKELGYNIVPHKKGVVPNSNLEPDILVPDLQVLIEIDGPAHFFPIFGEEKLQKTIASDNEKNGLFLQHGFCVLRVKHICKTLTEYKKRHALEDIVKELENIRNNHKNIIIDIEV